MRFVGINVAPVGRRRVLWTEIGSLRAPRMLAFARAVRRVMVHYTIRALRLLAWVTLPAVQHAIPVPHVTPVSFSTWTMTGSTSVNAPPARVRGVGQIAAMTT